MKRLAVSIIILIALILPSSILAMSDDRVSLGYIYNNIKAQSSIVAKTNGNINTVSPTCLDLSNDGHLVVNDEFISKEFVYEMHEKNIVVTPMLSNHWSKGKAKAALNNADVLTDEIVAVINEYEFDGINVDFENLYVYEKEQLTDFVKILKEKFGDNKIITVAVAANPRRFHTTWVAAYDYKELANYADYLVLMAYDEHSQGGAEGAVASLGFVEESIKVILEDVSRDKVVLGMPLYGRFWQKDAEEGGEAIILSQVERIIDRYKTSIPMYDESSATVKVTINVESGDKKAYVNGRYLEEGEYTIWYENKDSMIKKLDLMNDYGLKGSAFWAIGNEGKGFWEYFEKEFNDEEYESETSINQRIYYETINRIMEHIEPLKLRVPVDLSYIKSNEFNLFEIDVEAIHKLDTHDIRYPVAHNDEDLIQSENIKVIEKLKTFKKLELFTICHMHQAILYS